MSFIGENMVDLKDVPFNSHLGNLAQDRACWRIVGATILGACLCARAAESEGPTPEIWVVTDSMHPVKAAAGVRVIELDAPARLNAELAAHLPRDPVEAAAIAKQRIASAGTELERRLAVAYGGVVDAWSLGVSKIPAVIVERKYVVYGDLDVERALSRIEIYRSSHR